MTDADAEPPKGQVKDGKVAARDHPVAQFAAGGMHFVIPSNQLAAIVDDQCCIAQDTIHSGMERQDDVHLVMAGEFLHHAGCGAGERILHFDLAGAGFAQTGEIGFGFARFLQPVHNGFDTKPFALDVGLALTPNR